MNRWKTRTTQFVIDIIVLCMAFLLAVFVRFDWSPSPEAFRRLAFVMPYVVLLQYTCLSAFGITRYSWRYIGLRDAVRIFEATAVATLVLFGIRLAAPSLVETFFPARYGIVPFGVLFADFVLAATGVAGARALRRLIGERAASKSYLGESVGDWVPTLLIGAGQGGVLVAQEIARRPDLRIEPVAFIDDDPVRKGSVVHGIKVVGATAELERIAKSHGAEQALITIPNASGADIRRITEECKSSGLDVKIVPGTYQLVDDRVNLSRIRDVAIEDLLRRQPVQLNDKAIIELVQEKVVMITGAGGSIGSEICRQAAACSPDKLVLVEQAENNLFTIHRELLAAFPDRQVEPCIADVTDVDRMRSIFDTYHPDIVFHAAAHKHVPMMESNPCEAVKNNIFGTQIVADLAHQDRSSKFVMISTDKAVNPTSVMGTSKRVAELYIQALSTTGDTHFATVRFGNVLGSAGSVIPIFRQQIEAGGPVTVTHPDMKRYFMTIPEACQLVMQAAALSEGGEIMVLDMGEPIRIVDLATDLIQLSGLEPGKDIEIEFTGIRPGEKLFEELAVEGESIAKTRHPKIYVGNYGAPSLDDITDALVELRQLCTADQGQAVIRVLGDLVPEYATVESQ